MAKKLHAVELEAGQEVEYNYGGLWVIWTVAKQSSPAYVYIKHPKFPLRRAHESELRLPSDNPNE